MPSKNVAEQKLPRRMTRVGEASGTIHRLNSRPSDSGESAWCLLCLCRKAAAMCRTFKFLTPTVAKFGGVLRILSDSTAEFQNECWSPMRGKAPVLFTHDAVVIPQDTAIFTGSSHS